LDEPGGLWGTNIQQEDTIRHGESSQDDVWESNQGVILRYLRMEADEPQDADAWLNHIQIHCEGIQDVSWESNEGMFPSWLIIQADGCQITNV
jgi:hypothetical protein